jgi:hypothetical protein
MVQSEDHEDPEGCNRLYASVMDTGPRVAGTTAIAAQRWRRRARWIVSASIVTVALALTMASVAAAAADPVTVPPAPTSSQEPQAPPQATVRPLLARTLELASRLQAARDRESLALGALRGAPGTGDPTAMEAAPTATGGQSEERTAPVSPIPESAPQATLARPPASVPLHASRPSAKRLQSPGRTTSGGAMPMDRAVHSARPPGHRAQTRTYRVQAPDLAPPRHGSRSSNSTSNYSPAPALPSPGPPHGMLSVPPYASASLIFVFVAALIGMATIGAFRAPMTRAAPRRPRLLPAPVVSPLERPG